VNIIQVMFTLARSRFAAIPVAVSTDSAASATTIAAIRRPRLDVNCVMASPFS
jgi:hypothetical protein